MKINKTSFYRTLFIVVLLAQIYLPSFKINIFFQLGVLIIYFSLEKPIITVRLVKTITPLLAILFLGIIGLIFYRNPIGLALKDIFHFIKPIQGILIGYFIFKTINDTRIFIKTIVTTALISAIIHFLIILLFVDIASGSINAIRDFTKDNYLELMAIFFLGYYKFFFKQQLYPSKTKTKIVFIILLLSSFLYFSRTMMASAIIIALTIHGYTKITKTTMTILAIFVIAIGSLYGYLYSVKIDRGKPGLEAFLYKIKIAPEEIFKTKIDRDNHKELWDHWRGYEAKRALASMEDKPSSYIFGTGYGSLVNLKFKAPLSATDERGLKFISELHNGYPYVLYKTGILGLLLYLFFLVKLHLKIYAKFSFETSFISAIGLFYLFTTMTITGVYNTNDTIIFVLGSLFYGLGTNKKVNSDD